jgi:hypothetical protein
MSGKIVSATSNAIVGAIRSHGNQATCLENPDLSIAGAGVALRVEVVAAIDQPIITTANGSCGTVLLHGEHEGAIGRDRSRNSGPVSVPLD